MQRVLVTSTQWPYHGGASTNSYALVKYLRSNGIDAAGIFFDSTNNQVDPDRIGGIWRVNSNGSENEFPNIIKPKIIEYLGGTPDLILAKNYAAPILSRDMFSTSKIAYMVTGSPHMIKLSAEGISAKKYLQLERVDLFKPEVNAINASNVVIPNSKLGRKLLIKHYGNMSKILNPIDTSMAINNHGINKKFSDRIYDVAFIASNLKRDVKNAEFAKKIFAKIPTSKKIVLGDNNDSFLSVANTKVYPSMSHKDVIAIMNNTKVVICTSYYDASPNTIKEAISCGCNILLSENCGWHETYPREFVCSDVYDINEWIDKIKFLIKNDVKYSIDISYNNLSLIKNIRKIR